MSSETKPGNFRKLFFGLFIFPLVIAIGMAILLCAVVFLTHEEQTPDSLLLSIKTGAPSKRWQKAFELSNELNRQKAGIRASGTLREIIAILEDKERYDAKTRGFMAVALSHFKDPQAVAALIKALGDESQDVQIYSIWSLGILGDQESAKEIIPFLKSDQAELRKMSAYVLGVLHDRQAIEALKMLLHDASADVRWNAALSLAKFGDASGRNVLLAMLDRNTYAAYPMTENEIESAMINATKGLAILRGPEAIAVLESISRHEKNLRVRQAAFDAIQFQRNGVNS